MFLEIFIKTLIITVLYIIFHVIEMQVIPKQSMEHTAIFSTVPVAVITGLYLYTIIYKQ